MDNPTSGRKPQGCAVSLIDKDAVEDLRIYSNRLHRTLALGSDITFLSKRIRRVEADCTTRFHNIIMSSVHRRKPTGPLSPQYINGVYLPSAVLLLGVGVVNWHYLPAVAVVTIALGAWQVYNSRQ